MVKRVNANRISRILVAVDNSRESIKALDYAIKIARKQSSSLKAVSVIQYLKGGIVPHVGGVYDRRRISADRRNIKAFLSAAQKKAEKQGVDLITQIIEGEESIPSAIIKCAKSDKSNLVVVGTKRKRGIKRAFLGSVSMEVVTNAPCPTLVVK